MTGDSTSPPVPAVPGDQPTDDDRAAVNVSDLGPEGHVINREGGRCANSGCQSGGVIGEAGAYLHRNRETNKFALLCPSCSRQARLFDSLRLPLVTL